MLSRGAAVIRRTHAFPKTSMMKAGLSDRKTGIRHADPNRAVLTQAGLAQDRKEAGLKLQPDGVLLQR
ncbi:MAG: hypothetical protein R3F54_30035 [Alphaproteobacteria bacterium]